MKAVYPWSAVVGQTALKQALVLCAIDPAIGGVLVKGPRGVAKTTLARALSELVSGPFVELPLGATEERITGTLDLAAALGEQRVAFAPGLLARAHQGVLYVDEVNLLPDALVDLLLDAAATGQNVVERDGVSHTHDARFVLIGTMNPEEGELRPQLIDRFGLCAYAQREIGPTERTEIVRRRLEFDRDPQGFAERYAAAQSALRERCAHARARAAVIPLAGDALDWVAERCYGAHVEGVRADLAMLRAARAHAAWQGRDVILVEDVDAVAELALTHRRTPAAGGGGTGGGGSTSPAPGGGAAAGRGTDRTRGASGTADPASSSAAADGSAGTAAQNATQREPTGPGEPAVDGDKQATDANQRARGALAPVPVTAATRPILPAAIAGLIGRRAAAHRRGRAQLTAAVGSRARGRSAHGSIDWFGTLTRTPRPTAQDLLRRARRAPAKQLWILMLDCSASMLRHGALARAKALAHAFETRAARAGAHVALLSFRGAGARIEVSSRAGRAVLERGIAELAAGGATPLRDAILEAQRLCDQPSWRSPEVAKRVVLLTDARSREDLSDLGLARRDRELLVIDCERGPLRLNRAPHLAAALGGSYHHVDTLA